MSNTTENTTDIVTRSRFTDDWMSSVVRTESATLDTIAAAFAESGVNVFDDETDGIYNLELIEDKDFLRGLPFMITRWRFNTSDKFKDDEGNDGVFVSVEIAYQTDPNGPIRTGVFNDGSSGVCAQLQKITENRKAKGVGDPYAGRAVRKGLRRSDYMRDTGRLDKNNQPIMEAATTYYLDI